MKHVIKRRKIAPAVPTDSKSKISNDGILTDELPLTVKSSKKGGKTNASTDFYTEMLRCAAADQEISFIDLSYEGKVERVGLEARIANVWKRQRIRISVKGHLGFGALHTPIKTKTDQYGAKYFGELNADGKEHGRGI